MKPKTNDGRKSRLFALDRSTLTKEVNPRHRLIRTAVV